MRSFRGVTFTVFAAALCGGCASDNANREPGSYEQLQQSELDAERREFISETQRELDELAEQIDELSAKVDTRTSVDEEQRAAWSQELFEMRQERQRLRAELSRASSATDAEWKEMRGDFGGAVDSLQAGVTKLTNDVSRALSSEDEPQSQSDGSSSPQQQVGLCPLEVPGIEARVEREPGTISVVVKTSQRAHVTELQAKAHEIARREHYPEDAPEAALPRGDEELAAQRVTSGERKQEIATESSNDAPHPSSSSPDESDPGVMPVYITAEDTDDGAKLRFVPASEDLAQLQSRLERDVQRLDAGGCAPTSAVTMRSTSD